MNTFIYTIKGFDATTKVLEVEFADGGTAHIQLRAPLPTNKEELEDIIKTYTAPLEAIEARTAEVDLSYISSLIDRPQECERFSYRAKKEQYKQSETPAALDPEAEAILVKAEQEAFAKRVREVLIDLNLLPSTTDG